jgi:predicted DCC family thiol-disulfide oxidoreductase YuxK
MAHALHTSSHPVIYFDGVCNLCVHSVQFVIRRDPEKQFRFASLQSETGQKTVNSHSLQASLSRTFILADNGRIYTRSAAALRVAKKLKGLWPLLYVFMIIPAFIRDAVYDWIAKNRYRWFGKNETCWVPSPELNERFLD